MTSIEQPHFRRAPRLCRNWRVGLASSVVACAAIAGALAAEPLRTEQTLADRVDGTSPALYFHTADTAVMMCATPGLTVVANLISHSAQATGSAADKDAAWLKARLDNKDCAPLPPTQQFNATAATPIYAHSSGVVWVAGVFSPETPGAPAMGFVPLDRIAFVPPPAE